MPGPLLVVRRAALQLPPAGVDVQTRCHGWCAQPLPTPSLCLHVCCCGFDLCHKYILYLYLYFYLHFYLYLYLSVRCAAPVTNGITP